MFYTFFSATTLIKYLPICRFTALCLTSQKFLPSSSTTATTTTASRRFMSQFSSSSSQQTTTTSSSSPSNNDTTNNNNNTAALHPHATATPSLHTTTTNPSSTSDVVTSLQQPIASMSLDVQDSTSAEDSDSQKRSSFNRAKQPLLQEIHDSLLRIGNILEAAQNPTQHPEIQYALHLMNQVTLEDLGLTEAYLATITYGQCMTIAQEPDKFEIAAFILPRGFALQLHDHPEMTVCTKLLQGSIRIRSFSGKLRNEIGDVTSATLYVDMNKTHQDDAWLLTPSHGNFHEIYPTTDCVMLDILLPPYDDPIRPCKFYKAVRKSTMNETPTTTASNNASFPSSAAGIASSSSSSSTPFTSSSSSSSNSNSSSNNPSSSSSSYQPFAPSSSSSSSSNGGVHNNNLMSEYLTSSPSSSFKHSSSSSSYVHSNSQSQVIGTPNEWILKLLPPQLQQRVRLPHNVPYHGYQPRSHLEDDELHSL